MRRLAAPGMCALWLLLAGAAHADSNDLTLARLVPPAPMGGFAEPDANAIRNYTSLMSELGVVMAPRLLSPADTLGFSGFQVAAETSFTTISQNAPYWQKGVQSVTSGVLPTLSVRARKGIWLPLPSFELGAGVTTLLNSNINALEAYAKFALHEGFHGWPVPSLAVRGGVSKIVGTTDVDLTVVSIDASVSKSFGIGGVVRLVPYLGANSLLTIVRGQVLDTTPGVDAYLQGPSGSDLNNNTVFPDPDILLRWRLFAGLRVQWSYIAVTADVAYTLCNGTGSNCGDASKVSDLSAGQTQVSLSASLMF